MIYSRDTPLWSETLVIILLIPCTEYIWDAALCIIALGKQLGIQGRPWLHRWPEVSVPQASWLPAEDREPHQHRQHFAWPPSIKFDHGSTSWLSCLFNCCSVACGCRDWCGRNNLCHKSHICVWSLVCWSCWSPFCRPFFLLLHSSASFPLTWGVGSECFSTSCGRLQGPPRTRCWCQMLSCLSCRHPCSAAVGGLWITFQMPTLHRECLALEGSKSTIGRQVLEKNALTNNLITVNGRQLEDVQQLVHQGSKGDER